MSERTEKLSNQLKKDLGPILDSAGRQLLNGGLVTVMEVSVAPDLSLAKVYLSIFNVANRKEAFDVIKKNNKQIRKYLADAIGKHVRKIPELHFYLDESADRASKMDDLLKNLK
jgi:ribosome-binding factor A